MAAKELLQAKGLPASGQKYFLIQRLEDDLIGLKRIESLEGCPQETFDLLDPLAIREELSESIKKVEKLVDETWPYGECNVLHMLINR